LLDRLLGDDPPCAAAALAPSSHATGAMTCLLEDPRADGMMCFRSCDVLTPVLAARRARWGRAAADRAHTAPTRTAEVLIVAVSRPGGARKCARRAVEDGA
jgi:hypothetical protein